MEAIPDETIEKQRPVPKAMLFDLDDTLAKSFKPPEDTMIKRLSVLLDRMPVAIVTAAGLPRIEAGFLHRIQPSRKYPLYILANSSAQCFIFQDGALQPAYEILLTAKQREEIKLAIRESTAETGLPYNKDYIFDRDAQIAYAALGSEASEEAKSAWDPDTSKRKLLKAALDKRLPNYEVLIGGRTTIDITAKGMNKAYGVDWLSNKLGLSTADMLYVGDAFGENGNDAVVIPTGVQTESVKGPAETELIIDKILERTQ